jgi:hypothetical protein
MEGGPGCGCPGLAQPAWLATTAPRPRRTRRLLRPPRPRAVERRIPHRRSREPLTSTPSRAHATSATESASTFWTPRQPAELARGASATGRCISTWPSSCATAATAWARPVPGWTRIHLAAQVVTAPPRPHCSRSKPSRRASQVSASTHPTPPSPRLKMPLSAQSAAGLRHIPQVREPLSRAVPPKIFLNGCAPWRTRIGATSLGCPALPGSVMIWMPCSPCRPGGQARASPRSWRRGWRPGVARRSAECSRSCGRAAARPAAATPPTLRRTGWPAPEPGRGPAAPRVALGAPGHWRGGQTPLGCGSSFPAPRPSGVQAACRRQPAQPLVGDPVSLRPELGGQPGLAEPHPIAAGRGDDAGSRVQQTVRSAAPASASPPPKPPLSSATGSAGMSPPPRPTPAAAPAAGVPLAPERSPGRIEEG